MKCGHLGHITRECAEAALPAWEQSYLKEIAFGDPPRSSFAAAGYGEFDGQSRPYGSRSSSSTGMYGESVSDVPEYTPPASSSSSMMSGALGSSSSNMIGYGMAGLELRSGLAKPSPESKAPMAYYGEGYGPNKRPHVEEEPQAPQPSQPSQSTLQGSQPSQAPPHQPLPSLQQLPKMSQPNMNQPSLNQPNQVQPSMSQPNMDQGPFFQQPF